MANLLTLSRILMSIVLLFFPAFSNGFYILYLAAGFTDMIDGFVARKTGTVSALGEKLDTIADLVFVAVCLFKLLPAVDLPVWTYAWVGFVVLIKLCNVALGFILQKRFAAVHSVANKIAGACVFAFPLLIKLIDIKYCAFAVCAVATAAALIETVIIVKEKNNDHTRETV